MIDVRTSYLVDRVDWLAFERLVLLAVSRRRRSSGQLAYTYALNDRSSYLGGERG